MEYKLKIFISYSHEDNLATKTYIEQFKKHIVILKNQGLIEAWYDKEILPGEDYQAQINNKLENADVICLFLSANFLASKNCMNEKDIAFKLKKQNMISVVPIILSPCDWLSDNDLSKLLALPTDGKPVSTFSDWNEAWNNVRTELTKIIQKEQRIRRLITKSEFTSFLQDTEMLTKAHPQKEMVLLNDLFIYPELEKCKIFQEYKQEINYEKATNSEEIINNILNYPKIVIAGEQLSGKTTLCKMIFQEFRKRNLVPVYISDTKTYLSGKIEKRIANSLREQYESIDLNEVNDRIVPIVDNFHLAKDKEKHINRLSKYPYCVVIVDDIFSFNLKDEQLIGAFSYFRLKELKPSLRYELIKKWINLTDKENKAIDADNNFYKTIDKKMELSQ